MNSVQQSLANERESIVTAVSQMTYVSQDLKRCSQTIIEKMHHLDTSTQEIMSKEMQKVSQLITEEVSSKILGLLSTKSDDLVQKLQSTTDRCEADLKKSGKSISFFSKWFFAALIVATLLSGLIGGWLVHYSFPKMDQQMLAQFRSGEAMQAIWSKLDPKEREKLNSVYFDKKNKK
jgi:ferric iron reductase protein FhuF